MMISMLSYLSYMFRKHHCFYNTISKQISTLLVLPIVSPLPLMSINNSLHHCRGWAGRPPCPSETRPVGWRWFPPLYRSAEPSGIGTARTPGCSDSEQGKQARFTMWTSYRWTVHQTEHKVKTHQVRENSLWEQVTSEIFNRFIK